MIGQMRDRVVFARLNGTTDSYGNVTSGDYDNLFSGASYPCHFRPERGRERLEAGRLESAVAGVLTVRSDSQTETVTAADKATINGEAYQIRAITNPDRRGRYLEMTVERGAAN